HRRPQTLVRRSAETCNNIDDDCDGSTDEGLGSTTCGTGTCQRTVQVCDTPPTQLLIVRRHAPVPHVVVPRLSSVEPSQSSSRLLQTSVPGVPGVHVCGTPPTQFCTVRWQVPVPRVV